LHVCFFGEKKKSLFVRQDIKMVVVFHKKNDFEIIQQPVGKSS